ncbi:LamG-like jellyroll fold domain-containing protein [Rhodovulum sulfidophilum]|uniref:LamG-like jellyroll fold domain-containing protein n=1 Tax=Rhodovulum sulfidophilum TaxID=35806 RepID=UPI00095111BC|nr:LamG-like jellyroll fold domain-containing protein [Rhodovulum sulfidophilum]OLS51876.1 hypothetical protein BV392_07555 [Rhodovulum sulfidophilum]
MAARGIWSDWAWAGAAAVQGENAPPGAITGLSVQASGGAVAMLRWDRHPSLDVRQGGRIEFRHATAQAGASWQSSTGIGKSVSGGVTEATLPLKSGTYLARPYDAMGTPGPVSGIAVRAASIIPTTTVATLAEAPGFAGIATGCSAAGGVLAMAPGETRARYAFAGRIDLGAVQPVRLISDIELLISEARDLFWQPSGTAMWTPPDARLWLGSTDAYGDVDLQVSLTDDDPAAARWGMTMIGLALSPCAVRNRWSPAHLFTAGTDGAWYDAGRAARGWYQDADGTAPVAATDDPVGLALDRSGNGNDAAQTTDSFRPLFVEDGGVRYLDFDGTDDHLDTGIVPQESGMLAVRACLDNLDTTTLPIGSSGQDRYFRQLCRLVVGSDGRFRVGLGNNYDAINTGPGIVAAATWVTLAMTWDTDKNCHAYLDGTLIASGTYSGTVTDGYPLFLGASSNAGTSEYPLPGKISAASLLMGRCPPAAEIARLHRSWTVIGG